MEWGAHTSDRSTAIYPGVRIKGGLIFIGEAIEPKIGSVFPRQPFHKELSDHSVSIFNSESRNSISKELAVFLHDDAFYKYL